MNFEIFSLCDHAEDYGGKLSVLGAFDSIRSAAFPVVHPHCCVALRLRFQRAEEGQHTVRILMIDQDGRSQGPKIEAQVNAVIPEPLESIAVNLVIGMNGMPFPRPGIYHLDLAIDGQLISRLPLVIQNVGNQRAAA